MKLQIIDHREVSCNTTLFNPTAYHDGAPYWFPYVQKHLEEIGIEVKLLKFSEIDLTKKWIISLAPNAWNWNAGEEDILDGMSEQIQEQLIHGNAYLLINHECESFTKVFYGILHHRLRFSKLSPKKIIYMVGAVNPENHYRQFVIENNIPKDSQIFDVMSSFHVYKRLLSIHNYERDMNSVKIKKFLSLNRVPRMHRIMMVSLLNNANLLDEGFVSLGLEQENLSEEYRRLRAYFPVMNKEVLEGIKPIEHRLPLKIDMVDLKENQFQVNSLDSSFYDKSCFSLVSSTFALRRDEAAVGFTEKELKPILYKHPFIIHNLAGVLRHLKAMGFMTFDKWFDESYDEELDDFKRLKKIVSEIKRLCELSFEEWNVMLEEMKPILLHNYNRLMKYNSEHVFFNSDLKKFLHHVV